MGTQLSKRGITNILHTAFGTALGDVLKMSGEDSSSAVPEYFFTVKIAEALSANLTRERAVKMECSAATILQHANAVQRGPIPRDLRVDGRTDIAIYDRACVRPEAIIEVKRHVYSASNNAADDIRRLSQFLAFGAQTNSLAFGAFAFCTFIPGPNSDSRIDQIRTRLAQYHRLADKRGCLKIHTDFRDVHGLSIDKRVVTGVTILRRA